MEATVVGAYDLGVLDTKLLKVLLDPYKSTDIDHGGSQDLRAKDGLGADDIIIKLVDPKAFKRLEPVRKEIGKHPKNYTKLTEKQQEVQEQYYEDRYTAFNRAVKKFGW